MKIPIRIVRAALARHNTWVTHEVYRIKDQLQTKARQEVKAITTQIDSLIKQANDLRKKLEKMGWDTYFKEVYSSKPVRIEINLTCAEMDKRLKKAGISRPRKMEESELLLQLASTGETEIAAALDKLGLMWRPDEQAHKEDEDE